MSKEEYHFGQRRTTAYDYEPIKKKKDKTKISQIEDNMSKSGSKAEDITHEPQNK